MNLTQLNEKSKTTKMKTAFGDDIMVSYSEGKFWYNGENLGKTIADAKTKLADITNNSNFRRDVKNREEKQDEATISKSIDRHYKKLNKKPGEEFDFLKFLEMNESLDAKRIELSKATIAKIYKSVDWNDHNEAVIILAVALEKDAPTDYQQGLAKDLNIKLQTIKASHERNNSISEAEQKARGKIQKELLQLAEYTYTNYKDIKDAY